MGQGRLLEALKVSMKSLFCMTDCKKGTLSPDEMASPKAWLRGSSGGPKLGRKGQRLPLIHTFVKHLPCPEVQTGHVGFTGQSLNVPRGPSI